MRANCDDRELHGWPRQRLAQRPHDKGRSQIDDRHEDPRYSRRWADGIGKADLEAQRVGGT